MTQSQQPAWTAPVEPQGPAPGIQFAPPSDRLIAYILDGLIVGAFILIATLVAVAILLSGVSGTRDQPNLSGAAVGGFVLVILAIMIVATAYFPWFWARTGSTPGMRRFGLRVVRDVDGGPISGGQAILRFVGMWVSSAVLYLGFIWILIDARRRGWHDLIAGTLVVKG